MMRRLISPLLALALIAPASRASGDRPGFAIARERPDAKMPEPKPGHVWRPDPSYRPKVGDTATVWSPDGTGMAVKNADELNALAAVFISQDKNELTRMITDERIAFPSVGTKIRLQEPHFVEHKGNRVDAFLVTFMDGQLAGQTGCVPNFDIAQLIEVELSPSDIEQRDRLAAEKAKADAIARGKSDRLCRSAEQLEKAGKIDGAIKTYEEALAANPTPARAKEIAAKIAALKKRAGR